MSSILAQFKSLLMKNEKVDEKLESHRLIFSINSGRSGSQYLAKLLDTAKEVTAFHEAQPKMTGKYLRLIEEKQYAESKEERRLKSSSIGKQLLNLPKRGVYCDTSHMFIKTFYDVVIEDFKDNEIEVIVLRRRLASVLKSFMECGYFSEKNENWDNFFQRPYAVTSIVKPISQDLDKYDRCIAYLIDIEARAVKFQGEFPKIKVHNVCLEELQEFERVKFLFECLQITPTAATYEIYGKKSNTKIKSKRKVAEQVNLKYCQERIMKYLDIARSRSIQIPETIHRNI